jgi:hypothetical protein
MMTEARARADAHDRRIEKCISSTTKNTGNFAVARSIGTGRIALLCLNLYSGQTSTFLNRSVAYATSQWAGIASIDTISAINWRCIFSTNGDSRPRSLARLTSCQGQVLPTPTVHFLPEVQEEQKTCRSGIDHRRVVAHSSCDRHGGGERMAFTHRSEDVEVLANLASSWYTATGQEVGPPAICPGQFKISFPSRGVGDFVPGNYIGEAMASRSPAIASILINFP